MDIEFDNEEKYSLTLYFYFVTVFNDLIIERASLAFAHVAPQFLQI